MAYVIMFFAALFFLYCVGGAAGIVVLIVFGAYFFYCFVLNNGNPPRFKGKQEKYEPPWFTDGSMNVRELEWQWKFFATDLQEFVKKWVDMSIYDLEALRDENKAIVDLYESKRESHFPDKPYYTDYHIAHWTMDALNYHIKQRMDYEGELRRKEEKRKKKKR